MTSAQQPPHRFIFFPQPLPLATTPSSSTSSNASTSKSKYYLYGWAGDEDGTKVVAGAVDAFSFVDAQERLLQVAAERPELARTGCLCVLGTCDMAGVKAFPAAAANGNGKAKAAERGAASADTTTIEVLLSEGGLPYWPESVASHEEELGTFVLYKPPSRSNLQFFSLVPLQLDLNSFSLTAPNASIPAEDSAAKEAREEELLGEKVRRSAALDFTSSSHHRNPINLKDVVDRINLSPHLVSLLGGTATSHRPSISIPSFLSPILHLLSALVKHPLRILRFTAQMAILIANSPIPMLNGTALKDFSATVNQIDTRLSQTLSWPSQYTLIRQTLNHSAQASESASLALGRAHYIQFYNTMWLIANDVIVGSAFTSFVCENSEYFGHQLGEIIQVYTLDSIRELLIWLNSWPGGVKLNFELATMFCDAFLWGTGLWEDVIFTPLKAYLPTFVYLLGLSGLLGTTMFISFASDLLSLLTLHIFVFYVMATSLFHWHLSMLGALFNIFRGKKFNVLRNRVEPAEYEVDQLLLGTILFTLAAFLFPTVLAYYLAFAASRLGIVFMHAVGETVVAFMNHFPLFAVMLRFKDSARLPGGLQFDLVPADGKMPTYLRMTNNPIHLAGIFFQHLQLSRRLASHYSPMILISKLLAGRQISPIPRVRLRLWVDVGSLDATSVIKKEVS